MKFPKTETLKILACSMLVVGTSAAAVDVPYLQKRADATLTAFKSCWGQRYIAIHDETNNADRAETAADKECKAEHDAAIVAQGELMVGAAKDEIVGENSPKRFGGQPGTP